MGQGCTQSSIKEGTGALGILPSPGSLFGYPHRNVGRERNTFIVTTESALQFVQKDALFGMDFGRGAMGYQKGSFFLNDGFLNCSRQGVKTPRIQDHFLGFQIRVTQAL